MKASITKRYIVSVNNAPAVRYPVGRSSFQGRFLLVFGVLGLLVGGLWTHAVAEIGSIQFIYFTVLVFVLSQAGYEWKQAKRGQLEWGGDRWLWTTDNVAITGSMALHLDLQFLMVITLRDDRGRSVWLWVELASDPVRWSALRRAVYADKQGSEVAISLKEKMKTKGAL